MQTLLLVCFWSADRNIGFCMKMDRQKTTTLTKQAMTNTVFSLLVADKLIKTVLTNALLTLFVSDFGYGTYTARAIQLANIVARIKYSKGLKSWLRNQIFIRTIYMYKPRK